MDVAHQVGPGQGEQVVVAALVAALAAAAGAMRMPVRGERRVIPGGEPLAPVIRFLQLVALDHGAHRAVDHQDALGQRSLQFRDASRIQPGQRVHRRGFRAIIEITSKCGGRFSRVTVSLEPVSRPARSRKRRSSRSLKPRLTWP